MLKKILNVVKCWPQLTVVSVVFTVGHSHPSPRNAWRLWPCALCPTAQVVRRAPRVCHGPLAVSLGAPPPNLPTPPPLNVGRRRLYRRSLDVELGEDDVGDCRRRGTLAPIRSIVGGTVEGTRRSLFPRSLTKRNDAPRYRSLLSQEGSQTCPSMGF